MSTEDGVLLRARGLSVGYGRHVLASGLDLELRAGQMAALLGTNGRGKSTLLRTLSGSLRPLAGSVEVCGQLLEGIHPRQLARSLAIVCTDRTQASLTVEELVGMGRQPHTGFFGSLSARDRRVVEQALERVGMTGLRNRRIDTLSDGERQKAMIARALAQETPLVLLDEPTSFLDAASRLETMRLLSELAGQGKGVLLSTHDVAEALAVASHAWLLTDRGLETGTVDQAVASGAMDRLFQGRGVRFDPGLRDYRLADSPPHKP